MGKQGCIARDSPQRIAAHCGAGISTYFARRGIVPLSSDLIRQLLYDDPADQHHPEWAFACMRELL
jgi:hypothetical protein